jgi:hypothetical protein
LNGDTPDRPPLYDLLRNDAAIEYYAQESITQDNREQVVLRAIGKALDGTKQFIRFPEIPRVEKLTDGRKKTHQRWTYWEEPMHFESVNAAASFLRGILDNPESFIGNSEEYTRQGELDYLRKLKGLGSTKALLLEINSTEGFHNFYELIGLEMMAYLSVDFPDLIEKYLDLNVIRSERRIAALTIADQLPGVFYGVDLAYKSGPIFSPKFLRKVVFPRIEKLVAAYHQRGISVIFHSDGNLWSILDDLVALGIDGLNPIEVLAGMDLKELRLRYPHLILVGGIDCSQLLPFASPKEIADTVKQSIQFAGPGYLVGSSTELHNAIPLDNIKAMIDTALEYSYE